MKKLKSKSKLKSKIKELVELDENITNIKTELIIFQNLSSDNNLKLISYQKRMSEIIKSLKK